MIRRSACRPIERDRRDGGQRGAVTAEFAVVLPVAIVLALLVCALGRAVVLRVDCQDAAHTIAREAVIRFGGASGASDDAKSVPAPFTQWADDTAVQLAGSGARVACDRDGDELAVTVTAPLLADPWGIVPRLVTGRAVALLS